LSFGFPAPNAQPGRCRAFALGFSSVLTGQIEDFARAYRLTVEAVLAGAYGLLLGRYTDQEDVAFVLEAPPRAQPSITSQKAEAPACVRALPVRLSLEPGCSAAVFLRSVEEVILCTREDHARSLAEILHCCGLGRERELFEAALTFDEEPAGSGRREAANRPLTLAIRRNEGLRLRVVYDESRFDAASMQAFSEAYERLIEQIIADPEGAIGELSLLSRGEHQRIVVDWNNTKVPVSTAHSALELFEARVRQAPERLAIKQGERRLSYAELDVLADRMAQVLRERGARKGDLIAVHLNRSPEWIASLLAIWKVGAAYLSLDVAIPPERLCFTVQDSGASLLVTQPGALGIKELPADHVVVWGDAALEGAGEKAPALPASGADRAYVVYTSGSQGQPKGVVILQRGLLNLIQWHQRERDVTERDRGAQIAGLGFDATVIELWPYLTAGATVCLPDFDLPAPAQKLRDWLIAEEITVAFLPTPMTEDLLVEEWPQRVALRSIFTGGDRLKYRPPSNLPFALINDYGPAENTVAATSALVEPDGRGYPPIGRPIQNVQAYVLDRRMRPVPVGVTGELHLSGVGLAQGYLNRPELTQSKFIPNPFSGEPGARMYKTGDLVRYLPDGRLDFVGRADNQVKVRGVRVELREIETAIEEASSAVQQAIVLARESKGGTRLVAWLSTDGAEARGSVIIELREKLARRLPPQMLPSAFVVLDDFPRTPSGKIDRSALPEPGRARPALGQPFIAPRNPTEARLAEVWKDTLQLDQVGAEDNFFELGGDSLQMVRILSRLRAEGVVVTTADFLQKGTIAELAQQIDRQRAVDSDSKTENAVRAPALFDEASSSSLEQRAALRERLSHAEDSYALSPLQHGILFHTLRRPDERVYLVQIGLTIEGDLDARTLRAACLSVVKRHPILRTSFHWEGLREPIQIVESEADLPWMEIDWSSLDAEAKQEHWGRLVLEDRRKGFDLSQAPLFRFSLIRLGERAHRLLYSQMHLLMAEWEVFLVFDEIVLAYEALKRGETYNRPPPRPFGDFIRQLMSADLSDAKEFWRETLRGYESAPFSFGFSEQGAEPGLYRKVELRFPRALTEHLAEFARAHRLTVNSVLTGALGVLLGRYTDREDVVFGLTLSGRAQLPPGMEETVGLFINTLPLRLHPQAGASVRDYLNATQRAVFRINDYEQSSLVDVRRWSEADRGEAGEELFDVILVFDEESLDVHLNRRRSDLSFRDFEVYESSNYPLTVAIIKDDELLVQVLYDASRFDAASVGAFAESYRQLIERMLADAEGSIGALDVLSQEDHQRIVIDWNNTAADFPMESSTLDLFEERVRRAPERLAVQQGERRLSYAELHGLAGRMARALKDRGARRGDLIAVYLDRSPEWIASLLAIWEVGAAYLPLDALVPPERLRFIVEDSGAALVVTRPGRAEIEAFFAARVVVWDEATLGIEREPVRPPSITASDRACVIFTSGSTGEPKGVILTHGSLHNFVTWFRDELRIMERDRGVQAAGLGFDAPIMELWPLLTAGAAVCLPDFEIPAPPRQMRDWLIEQNITIVPFLVTPLAEEMLNQEWPEDTPFRAMTTGGERLKARPPAPLPFELFNGYGPTENTVYSTFGRVSPQAQWGQVFPSIGRPLANVRAYILDRRLRPVPVGVVGELYLSGMNLSQGYLNRPDLTLSRFIPNPFSKEPGARMYRTGDMARYLPDGSIDFIGRADNQVKILGVRVELGEIETAIKEVSPCVRQAVVLARESGRSKRLIAYLTTDSSSPAIAVVEHLRAQLPRRLPRQMLPSAFVALDAFPVTPNGKIDRRALPEPEVTREIVGPNNSLEEILCAIWADILELDQVGTQESFFALGGHSLLATRLVSRIRDVFQTDVSLAEVFELQTVAEQAALIARHRSGERRAPRVVPIPRSARDPLLLSYSQQRLWFLHALNPASSAYNVLSHFHLTGDLDAAALEAALGDVVERHEVLRARFGSRHGEPYQTIEPHGPVCLEQRACPAGVEPSSFAREVLETEALRTFDLARDALTRFILLTDGPERYVLIINIHHIVFDGWSLGIFLKELGAAYEARLKNEAPSFHKLAAQYPDFAVAQRAWMRESLEAQQLPYWLQRLSDLPPLRLPADFPRPPVQTFRGASQDLKLSPELTRALDTLCQQEGVTLFMVLLAGYYALVYRYTRQEDLAVACPIANRNISEIEGLIGFFVNTLILRCDLSGDPSFRGLLRRVRQVALEAYQYQDLPFDRVVEVLRPQRGADHIPLVQTLFALQSSPVEPLKLSGLSAAPAEFQAFTTRFDQEFHLWSVGGGVEGQLVYNTDLFMPATIDRLVRHYQRLLEAAARDPDRPVSRLPLLDEGEQAGILLCGRGPETAAAKSAHALFEAHARRRPDKAALIYKDKSISYRELNERANRLRSAMSSS
jgi:amino acid adenylation domain-containing protein